MTDPETESLLANPLKFRLEMGFNMEAGRGVPAVVRRHGGAGSAVGAHYDEPRTEKAICNVDLLNVRGWLQCRLPIEFLLSSIGAGENTCVLEGDEVRGAAKFGNAPQDGSEIYLLSRIELAYREDAGDQSFRLTANIALGEPLVSTFIYHGPVDVSDVTFQATMMVHFRDIFSFVFPTTKVHAAAIIARLDQAFALTVAMPRMTVNK